MIVQNVFPTNQWEGKAWTELWVSVGNETCKEFPGGWLAFSLEFKSSANSPSIGDSGIVYRLCNTLNRFSHVCCSSWSQLLTLLSVCVNLISNHGSPALRGSSAPVLFTTRKFLPGPNFDFLVKYENWGNEIPLSSFQTPPDSFYNWLREYI